MCLSNLNERRHLLEGAEHNHTWRLPLFLQFFFQELATEVEIFVEIELAVAVEKRFLCFP